MSITDIEDYVFGDKPRDFGDRASDNSGMWHGDPWYIPRDNLAWYNAHGDLHEFYVSSNSLSAEYVVKLNYSRFPDLYKHLV